MSSESSLILKKQPRYKLATKLKFVVNVELGVMVNVLVRQTSGHVQGKAGLNADLQWRCQGIKSRHTTEGKVRGQGRYPCPPNHMMRPKHFRQLESHSRSRCVWMRWRNCKSPNLPFQTSKIGRGLPSIPAWPMDMVVDSFDTCDSIVDLAKMSFQSRHVEFWGMSAFMMVSNCDNVGPSVPARLLFFYSLGLSR